MNKYLPAEGLRSTGVIQELNRQFLHPLGLALEVSVDKTGKERIAGITMVTEDAVLPTVNAQKADNVQQLRLTIHKRRSKALGFAIQPLPKVQKEDLAVGKIFRGKHPKKITETAFNDRIIIEKTPTHVKYDAADVTLGAPYPQIKIAVFLSWAGFEITE